MPQLIKEFEYFVDVGVIDDVGLGPFGQRSIATYTGGQIAGDRLNGTITGAAGEWALISQDGFNRRDERLTFKTVDGALIYVQISGLTELTPAIMDILAGGDTPTNFGDQYFFTNPRMETGDERYSWVNRTMFIGEGRVLPAPPATPRGRARIEFRVYCVANS